MAAMALRRGVCPESQAIQRNLSKVVDRVTKSAGPLWLSQKLQEKGFMSAERAADILDTLGTSSSDKVSSLMEAVESRIKCSRDHIKPFQAFVTMLQNEPSLKDVADMLEGDYQELVGNESAVDACDSSEDRTPLLLQHEVPISRETHLKPSQAKHNKCCPVMSIESPLCVCCSIVSAAAIMTASLMITAMTSFTPNNSEMKVKRSVEQGTTPAVVPSLFTFLWTIFPTVLMFAIFISSYCRCWYLRKRLSPAYNLCTIVTVLIYIVALFMGLRKLNSGSGLMIVSALFKGPSKPLMEVYTDFVLCGYYLMQYIRIFEPVITVLFIYIPLDIRPGRSCYLLYVLIGTLLGMGVLIITVLYIWYNSTIALTVNHLSGMLFGATVGIYVPPLSTMDDIDSSMGTLSSTKLIAIFIPALCLCILYYIIGIMFTGTMLDVWGTCCLAGLMLFMPLFGFLFCYETGIYGRCIEPTNFF